MQIPELIHTSAHYWTKKASDQNWHYIIQGKLSSQGTLTDTSCPHPLQKKRGFISPECHRSKIGETSLFQYLNQPKRVLWDWSRMHPNQMTLSKQNTPWKSIKKKNQELRQNYKIGSRLERSCIGANATEDKKIRK